MAAYCNKICPGLGVIIPFQPDRSAVMDFWVISHIELFTVLFSFNWTCAIMAQVAPLSHSYHAWSKIQKFSSPQQQRANVCTVIHLIFVNNRKPYFTTWIKIRLIFVHILTKWSFHVFHLITKITTCPDFSGVQTPSLPHSSTSAIKYPGVEWGSGFEFGFS